MRGAHGLAGVVAGAPRGLAALLAVCVVLSLGGCGAAKAPAPVRQPEGNARQAPRPASRPARAPRPAMHVVARGDTLYSIAFRYDLDHRDVARWNGLANADRIYPGQRLRLYSPPRTSAPRVAQKAPKIKSLPSEPAKLRRLEPAPAAGAQRAPSSAKRPATATAPRPAVPKSAAPAQKKLKVTPGSDDAPLGKWQWPARGNVIRRYGGGSQGVDIAGRVGDPVRAASPGRVVYSGGGLRGYGKLIIVKHNKRYLSAYAHNDEVFVKEGDLVSAGQRIAAMGRTGTDRVKLHFEIRRDGRPVNPLLYLPK